jgi:hypothetical protein
MTKCEESFHDFEDFLEYLGGELHSLPDRPWNITITHGRNGSYSVRVTCSDEVIETL